jgi:lincosamide nucleotidyltransferase A/C/D/E
MTISALASLLHLFEAEGLVVWLDGGWGVDALLGEQTRPHGDVDLVVALEDVPRLEAALARRGFGYKRGTRPTAFVLGDADGLEVDIHAVRFDEAGNGVYRMENGADWVYPASGFAGQGLVAGRPVNCLTPEIQVLCHADGYTPVEKDFADMAHLAERFGVALPARLRAGSDRS